jgi:hypothetical protein
MVDDLNDLFPEARQIAASIAVAQRPPAREARAIATRNRHQVRRAKSEAALADILPAHLEAGVSYHVISHGDIDSRSYVDHVLRAQRLDRLLVSTWCMSMDDVVQFREHLTAGRVGAIDFYVGEIFPSQYPDEFLALRKLCRSHGSTFCVARNHSKVMAGQHAESGFAVVIESSANVNTNPRIEQTVLTVDQDLHDFYRDFFDGLRSIHRDDELIQLPEVA